MNASTAHDAYEERVGRPDAPIFLTCEHASEALPAPWTWPEADRRLIGTHWAYDLGAREITLELAAALDASAVLARFTRLLVDPNREEQHPDLFRAVAEGEPVSLNRALSSQERERRLSRYHRPYHAAVDAGLLRTRSPVLFSVHSFTPVYEGSVRHVQLGVLFNREEAHARALGEALSAALPSVAYNEPWSGRQGLIYSAESHAERHGRIPLEIEVRQDLAADPSYRARLVAVLAEYFTRAFSVR